MQALHAIDRPGSGVLGSVERKNGRWNTLATEQRLLAVYHWTGPGSGRPARVYGQDLPKVGGGNTAAGLWFWTGSSNDGHGWCREGVAFRDQSTIERPRGGGWACLPTGDTPTAGGY